MTSTSSEYLPGVVNPLDSLNAEQQEKIKKLREVAESWNLAQPEKDFIDELCLWRFLKGLHWDFEVAKQQLKETIDWRVSYKPQLVKLADVQDVAKQAYLFQHGFDKKHRPIIYLNLGKDKYQNDEKGQQLKLKNVVYVMEETIKKMPRGVYSATWIIDASQASLSISLVKQMKDMFTKLGDYYTERLAMAVVINIPWTLSVVWSLIKNFLQPETVAKYQIISGDVKSLKEQLTKHIDEDQLIEEYGGKSKFKFDIAAALKEEAENPKQP